MLLRRIDLLLLGVLCWVPATSASALAITLNGYSASNLTTYARDAVGADAWETLYPASTGYLDSSSVVDGAASATSRYLLSDSGFGITFEHARTPTIDTRGQSYGYVYFRVDEDVVYTALGTYTVVDSTTAFSHGRTVILESQIYDLTTSSFVYLDHQDSRRTANESFTLGDGGGDFDNVLSGSLTGTLVAGHDYRFFYQAMIDAYPVGLNYSATATGFVSLSFVPVPESSTGTLVGIGMVALASRRARRARTRRAISAASTRLA
jgi:hypothetical protein